MSGTQIKLDNGTVATGVVTLNQDGSVSGISPANMRVSILGKCITIVNVLRTLWDGPTALYVPPATPIGMQVVSSSVADTAAGTGVQKVQIDYLDTDYKQQSEIVTLNGTTAVPTVATNILRVNDFFATEIGTGRISAGTIYCKQSVEQLHIACFPSEGTEPGLGFIPYRLAINSMLIYGRGQAHPLLRYMH